MLSSIAMKKIIWNRQTRKTHGAVLKENKKHTANQKTAQKHLNQFSSLFCYISPLQVFGFVFNASENKLNVHETWLNSSDLVLILLN